MVLGLSSGYDSGLVHLTLLRLCQRFLLEKARGFSSLPPVEESEEIHDDLAPAKPPKRPVPLRTYTISAKENIQNVLARFRYARAVRGRNHDRTDVLTSSPPQQEEDHHVLRAAAPHEENFVVYLTRDKLAEERADLHQNLEPFAYTRAHPGGVFLIHEDVASWGHSWVFRDARKHGYLINLSGTGGDEIYGGDYGRLGRNKQNKFVAGLRGLLEATLGGGVLTGRGSQAWSAGGEDEEAEEGGEQHQGLPGYKMEAIARNASHALFLDDSQVGGAEAKARLHQLRKEVAALVSSTAVEALAAEAVVPSPGTVAGTASTPSGKTRPKPPPPISFSPLEFISKIANGHWSAHKDLFGLPFSEASTAGVSVFPPHLFPWPDFFTGTMRDFLMKEELVAGRHGVESRYPFLDIAVVQEFLWLKGDVKNAEYKGTMGEAFRRGMGGAIVGASMGDNGGGSGSAGKGGERGDAGDAGEDGERPWGGRSKRSGASGGSPVIDYAGDSGDPYPFVPGKQGFSAHVSGGENWDCPNGVWNFNGTRLLCWGRTSKKGADRVRRTVRGFSSECRTLCVQCEGWKNVQIIPRDLVPSSPRTIVLNLNLLKKWICRNDNF